jgi:hypothetical protein
VSTVGLGSGVLLLEGVSVGRRSLFLLDEVDRSGMRARVRDDLFGESLGDGQRRSVCVTQSRVAREEEKIHHRATAGIVCDERRRLDGGREGCSESGSAQMMSSRRRRAGRYGWVVVSSADLGQKQRRGFRAHDGGNVLPRAS